MITKNTVTLFTATDGSKHEDLEQAKHASLSNLLGGQEEIASILIEHSSAVVDILTTTPTSLPRARKANGGRKPRKSKQLEIPADAYVPVKGDPSLNSPVAA